MKTLDVSNLSQLEKIAKEMISAWKKGRASQVLWLQGPMGSGKTTFVRCLVGEQASSPSFALQQIYGVTGGEIQHWDLDRINSLDELEGTGFFDIFQSNDEKKLIIIEWANRLEEFGRSLFAPAGWSAQHLRWKRDGDKRSLEISKVE